MIERFCESRFWDLGWKAVTIVTFTFLFIGLFTFWLLGLFDSTASAAGYCHWHYIWEWWSGSWHMVWAYTCSMW